MNIKPFDSVILTKAIPEKNLLSGEVGTVVDYQSNKSYCTVEFFRNGEPFAVETIELSALQKEQSPQCAPEKHIQEAL
ncbi:MAG: DUF4926 domain-containing protein [Chloroherpetonaceae bacterium]